MNNRFLDLGYWIIRLTAYIHGHIRKIIKINNSIYPNITERCPRLSQTAVDNAESLTMIDIQGNLTKEIDIGTVAVVECMTG